MRWLTQKWSSRSLLGPGGPPLTHLAKWSIGCLILLSLTRLQFLSKREVEEPYYSGPLGLFCGVFGGGRTRTYQPQMEAVSDGVTTREASPPTLIADERTRTEYYQQFEDLNRADPKIKNIRQTELLVNLRQAILAVSLWGPGVVTPLAKFTTCSSSAK